jgi:RNA polymerase sigma factor (sigma-70 family)
MNVSDFLILMVEDDPDQILLSKRALAKANLVNPLRVVTTGDEAIAYLSGKAPFNDRKVNPLPSLILLDLKLPKIGGLEILEWLRSQPQLKNIPVTILTASINPKDRQRADELGISAYLCKPVAPEGLLEMMKSIGMYWMILEKNRESSPTSKGASGPGTAHVLLVDADRDCLSALTEGLHRRSPGVLSDTADDLKEGLRLLRENSYDAVVVDRDSAEGLGFVAEIRSVKPGMPIFILDAQREETFERKALDSGATRVIAKRPRLKDFIDDLHRNLSTLKPPPVPPPAPGGEPAGAESVRASSADRRSPGRHDTEILGDNVRFGKTSWELVRAATEPKGMDDLIRLYWKPLYYFVRQKGFDNEMAKDMVQGFLADALERGTIAKADPSRGKFRTFLLAALSNYMKDWHKSSNRLKRGGNQSTLSLDFDAGERQYAFEVASGEQPEITLDRAWAQSAFDACIAELQGTPRHLQAFRMVLQGSSYLEIAEELGISESAAKTAVFRLRQQLREGVLRRMSPKSGNSSDEPMSMADFAALLR